MEVDGDPALPRHKQVLRDVMVIKDLQPPAPPPVVPLHIRNKDNFFAGQASVRTSHASRTASADNVQAVIGALSNWTQATKEVCCDNVDNMPLD